MNINPQQNLDLVTNQMQRGSWKPQPQEPGFPAQDVSTNKGPIHQLQLSQPLRHILPKERLRYQVSPNKKRGPYRLKTSVNLWCSKIFQTHRLTRAWQCLCCNTVLNCLQIILSGSTS